jgi:hypothetical protein
MFRALFVVIIILFLSTLSAICSAQSEPSTASCNLDDGRQVYIRYNPISAKDKISNGKPWAPGGSPMTLFTEAELNLGGSTIPIGAYTVYPIPDKKWTLVVNKNVAPGSAYDEKQDLARTQMETDQVSQPSDALEVAFAHTGDKCTLRIYFGKTASFAPFTAK